MLFTLIVLFHLRILKAILAEMVVHTGRAKENIEITTDDQNKIVGYYLGDWGLNGPFLLCPPHSHFLSRFSALLVFKLFS